MLILVWIFSLSAVCSGSEEGVKFRTCKTTSFCRRNRDPRLFKSQNYQVIPSSVKLNDAGNVITAQLGNYRHPLQEPLELTVSVIHTEGGLVYRAKVNEINPLFERYEVKDVLQPFQLSTEVRCKVSNDRVECSSDKSGFQLHYAPFRMHALYNKQPVVVANAQAKMMFEPYRSERVPRPKQKQKPPKPSTMKYPYDFVGMWKESFNNVTDTKPRGPSAVAMDFDFPGSRHVFGIPEHTSPATLRSTKGKGTEPPYNDPYRLYNLDVFKYKIDTPAALYGSIPFLVSQRPRATGAVYWNNAAETWVDVSDSEVGKRKLPVKNSHWISESGVIDAFLFAAAVPTDVWRAYAVITGYPALPPAFALGYHQSRWNYKDEKDVRTVDANFDKYHIPYDVLWLDIEHTDKKKYLTWDTEMFPDPVGMQAGLSKKKRKMVVIVDPHIARKDDYSVHVHAEKEGLYVTDAKGVDSYKGHCWPGPVSYFDFFLPAATNFWIDALQLENYNGSTKDLYIWNDMNEPSVFNGPEMTFPKDLTHMGGTLEHREVHNLYGQLVHKATQQALLKRAPDQRPFVLSRSFFAGSQKYGAVWTGDNMAEWSHLMASISMLLSLSVAGLPFVGADVGGFFGNPDPELLVRWYQLASFTPFFRAHAHVDSARREPWLFGKMGTGMIREAISRRYTYMPYLYTSFFEAHLTGLPVMLPMWALFPEQVWTYDVLTQFMLGKAILVAPVLYPQTADLTVMFPHHEQGFWYDTKTALRYEAPSISSVHAPIWDGTKAFHIGGSVVSKRERARRSTESMVGDPLTLVVCVGEDGTAVGEVVLDDGNSFEYTRGGYVRRSFHFSVVPAGEAGGRIAVLKGAKSEFSKESGNYLTEVRVERILVFGLLSHLSAQGRPLDGQAALQAFASQEQESRPSSVEVILPSEEAKAKLAARNEARLNALQEAGRQREKHEREPVLVDMVIVRKPWVLVDLDFEITLLSGE